MGMGIAQRLLRGALLCLALAAFLPHQAGAGTAKRGGATQKTHPVATKHLAARKSVSKAKPVRVAQARKAPLRQATAERPRRSTAAKPAQVPNSLPGRPLIVIDPGHGGRDPGAIGASGSQEKAVTLAAALELRRVLEATGHYRVAMTRTGDVSMSLDDRLAFARRQDADLLIAIHADASPDRRARGASVYVSSGSVTKRLPASRGSSGRIASALSEGTPQPEPGSAFLQFSMIEQLSDEVRMVATPARNAHLYVLGARAIPSVLLEMGFLSNRQDEALLRQPGHRGILVRAIGDAIADYFAGVRSLKPRT